jgi:glycosyltransferase involved in cell wall biosynthesis
MNILLLAPHPIYQDRGSPIAVNTILKLYSEQKSLVDVVTYHEGKDINYDNINIHRIPNISFVKNVRPGFSWEKVVCDFFMIFKIMPLVMKNQYQLVHAVEESVFFALMLKLLYKIPYIYDMDSSLAQQMVEQIPWLSPFSSLLSFFEGIAVKNALVVIPVCDSLAKNVVKYHPRKIVTLHDVSLLKEAPVNHHIDLKAQFNIDGLLLMYVGNLQKYQGIDLMLEGFALAQDTINESNLIIIGGSNSDIEKYRLVTNRLGISSKVHFLGPKPIEYLSTYLSQADILISPRIKGNNTPMKLFSYLHSGKPVLATHLQTHTQVVDDGSAVLVEPDPSAFSRGIIKLINDENLRHSIGMAGKNLIESKYSYPVFREKVNQLHDWLQLEVTKIANGPSA